MSLDFTKVNYVDGSTIIEADNLNDIQDAILALDSNKVESESGKGLSTEDYTSAEKSKLSGIQAGAQVNPGNATTSVSGLMSSVDKIKLDGISTGATAVTIDSTLTVEGQASDAKATGDALAKKYEKPSGGIPDSDIASASTWNAKGTYSKPSGGIPKSDLASAVQTSLDKADSALQSVPSTYRTAAAQDVIDESKQTKITASGILKGNGSGGVSAATAGTDYGTYSKPNTGIPKTDLASDVQASLEKADTALQSGALPSGGTDGDVLVKSGATDYDAIWKKTPPQMASLATIEPTSSASKAYAAGDYLVYNGQLYKVTASTISQGQTLDPTPDSGNIEAISVSDSVQELNTTIAPMTVQLSHLMKTTINYSLVSVDDMRSAENVGIYLYNGFAGTLVTQNMPFTNSFGLLFVSADGGGGWYQVVINIATAKIYRRQYSSSWSNWMINS